MLLERMTWKAVSAYLERSAAVIVPIGATEQHAEHGLLGTDAICAEAVARGVGDASNILVAPTLSIGMSQFHLAFPGSLTLRPSTLQAVVTDVVRSLSKHGFRRIYFLNGHGGNISPVSAAFQEFYAEHSLAGQAGNAEIPRLRLRSWWQGSRTTELVRALYGEAEGYHATASEIAMVQHLHPDSARGEWIPAPGRLQDAVETNHYLDEYYDAADFRAQFPVGTVGSDPSLSNAADGARILAAAIADTVDDLSAFASA